MGVSTPSLLIQSTDSRIIIMSTTSVLLTVTLSTAAAKIPFSCYFAFNPTWVILNFLDTSEIILSINHSPIMITELVSVSCVLNLLIIITIVMHA